MPDIDIAQLMPPLGPFERPPVIAAAVSGGSDSLGLGLLLAEWVRAQGGHLHILTVDHGLRSESAGECARVAEIFAAISNCSVNVLRWQGSKPRHGVQAAARGARYALLTEWCRGHGVLHLAVAHTAEDQAETIAMRQAHGSGAAGLAGMPAVRSGNGVRLLRPLLRVSRAAIRAWLQARGQDWIEDPSNELVKYERVRIRQSLTAERSAGLLEDAQRFGETRDALERSAARLLAQAGQVHEAGYVSVALAPLLEAAAEVRATILRQIILSVSGADYAPAAQELGSALAGGPQGRRELALERISSPDTGEDRGGGSRASVGGSHRSLPPPQPSPLSGEGDAPVRRTPPRVARTLGGCIVQILRGRLHIFREAAAIGDQTPAQPGWSGTWDNRFALQVSADLEPAGGWIIAPLGEHGLRQAVDRFGIRLKRHPIPLPARLTLPALWQGEHLAAQPHLHLGQGLAAWPAPRHTVTTCGFTVAGGRQHTIYSPVLC